MAKAGGRSPWPWREGGPSGPPLPTVVIQAEALADWLRGALGSERERGRAHLATLVQGLAAFGVNACFLAYGATSREIRRVEGELRRAAAKSDGPAAPEVVFITKSTVDVGLLYAATALGPPFERALLVRPCARDG